MNRDNLLKVINHFGIDNQVKKFAEESFELQESIIKYETMLMNEWELSMGLLVDGKEHIKEELGDCFNLLFQIMEYYDFSFEEELEVVSDKLSRTLDRINLARINDKYYNKNEK